MRKYIFIIITIIISILVYVNVNADSIVIPDAAIRVRVIASSNTIHDQEMKMKVKKYIEQNLSVKLLEVEDVNTAREIITSYQDELEAGIQEIFDKNGYDKDFVIHFGDNYFPDKDYRGVKYSSGMYESLVVTIGEGAGDNWWCVLFPPLCLLDASEDEGDDVEYQFFVKEMLSKIFE